jgi:hypothetical protein
MFIGHTAMALAAKAKARDRSLGLLLAAALGLDLLWPVLLLAGVERVRIAPGVTAFSPLAFESYPWSHSLLMTLAWGALAAAVVARKRGGWSFPLLIGALVVSHWVLDFVSHRPDLPLWPGASPRVGLGLWYSIPASFVVEGGLFLIGLTLYLRTCRPRDWVGRLAFWSFVGLSVLMWAGGPWSPPPPSARALAWFGMANWLLIAWGWWADRHWEPRSAPDGTTTRAGSAISGAGA